MTPNILTKNGIVDAQVCSAQTYDDALKYIRKQNPSGTQLNWKKNKEGKFAPVKCEKYPERTHYMFVC